MTQKNSNKIISVVHPVCWGLDVHMDMVSACIIIPEPDGEERFVVQNFSTFTLIYFLTLETSQSE